MRERLVDAARQCLLRDGYERTSAREILQRAGVSAGTLYNYFESKDELFAAVADRFGEAVSVAPASTDDPDETLANIVFGNFVADRPPSLQPALRARAAADERTAAALRRYDQTVEQALLPILEQARARGSIRPDVDLPALVELVAICFEGLEARRSSRAVRTSRRRIAALLVELLGMGVAAPRSKL